jgi:energy-coupling factor transporter transmembrane protein EcfT
MLRVNHPPVIFRTHYHYFPWSLVICIGVTVLLITSVAIVVECGRRRLSNSLQFSVRSLLLLPLIVGAMVALDPPTLYELFDRSWYMVAALLFALGCTTYLAATFAVGMATHSVALLRRPAPATAEADGSSAQ